MPGMLIRRYRFTRMTQLLIADLRPGLCTTSSMLCQKTSRSSHTKSCSGGNSRGYCAAASLGASAATGSARDISWLVVNHEDRPRVWWRSLTFIPHGDTHANAESSAAIRWCPDM